MPTAFWLFSFKTKFLIFFYLLTVRRTHSFALPINAGESLVCLSRMYAVCMYNCIYKAQHTIESEMCVVPVVLGNFTSFFFLLLSVSVSVSSLRCISIFRSTGNSLGYWLWGDYERNATQSKLMGSNWNIETSKQTVWELMQYIRLAWHVVYLTIVCTVWSRERK